MSDNRQSLNDRPRQTVVQKSAQMGMSERMRREAGIKQPEDSVRSAMRSGGPGRRFRARIEG